MCADHSREAKLLAAHVLFQYADGTCQEWKRVLDWLFDRFNEGRGAIFSTIPTVDLINRRQGRRSRLPEFFKFALRSLRELPIRPVSKGSFIDVDEARAEPLWTSPRLHVTNLAHADQWRYELTLNRLRDFIDPTTLTSPGLMTSRACLSGMPSQIRAAAMYPSSHIRICLAGNFSVLHALDLND